MAGNVSEEPEWYSAAVGNVSEEPDWYIAAENASSDQDDFQRRSKAATLFWQLVFVIMLPNCFTLLRCIVHGWCGKTKQSYPWPRCRSIITVSWQFIITSYPAADFPCQDLAAVEGFSLARLRDKIWSWEAWAPHTRLVSIRLPMKFLAVDQVLSCRISALLSTQITRFLHDYLTN